MIVGTLRKYLWLWVIAGMVLVSVLIVLIFVLIIKCISRRVTQSYENLGEAPDWSPGAGEASDQQDPSASDQDSHDYEELEHADPVSEHSLPDYVSVDNVSTEDYDDVDEACSEEDYDDVD